MRKWLQRVEARHRLNPDPLIPGLFSFSYTSMAQLSDVLRNNNGFQDDLKMIGRRENQDDGVNVGTRHLQ